MLQNQAVWEDFCEAFATDTKPLYLLAFLLTANHRGAEQSFAATLDAVSEATVFKDWVRPWIRRTLIKVAIGRVLGRSGDNSEIRDSWRGADAGASFNAVAHLDSLERLVFVMSVLEGHSIKECSLLLDRSEQEVVTARLQALKDLSLDRAPRCFAAKQCRKAEIS
jgi:DNA-directed RNA polymerase specialized sigma24 family protein